MTNLLYKRKISESLDGLDDDMLKQAWLILQEIKPKKIPPVEKKKELETKLKKGIRQLDNGEGTDMGSFIKGLKRKYGQGKA